MVEIGGHDNELDLRYFYMVEIGGHDNGLDVKLKEEGRTQGYCWMLSLLDCWGKNVFLLF